MVLDGIVGAAGEQARDGGPAVAVLVVGSKDGVVLRRGEGAVLHRGAELVAPPQAARFPGTTLYVLADHRPVSWAVPVDEAGQDPVLLGAPWTFDSLSVPRVRGSVGGRGAHRRTSVVEKLHALNLV